MECRDPSPAAFAAQRTAARVFDTDISMTGDIITQNLRNVNVRLFIEIVFGMSVPIGPEGRPICYSFYIYFFDCRFLYQRGGGPSGQRSMGSSPNPGVRQSECAWGARAAAPRSSSSRAWNGSEARATRDTKRSPRCRPDIVSSSSFATPLWTFFGQIFVM